MPYNAKIRATTEPKDPTGTNISAPLGRRNDETLNTAFPKMPRLDQYTADTVQAMFAKLAQNKIGTSPAGEDEISRAQSSSHWGGEAADFDLSYSGAPDLSEHPGTDSKGNKIASAYMPNLLPPTNFDGPDNPTAAVPEGAAVETAEPEQVPDSPADSADHTENQENPATLPAEGAANSDTGQAGIALRQG